MNNLLALDLGTTSGWALVHNGHTTSGTINFKNDRFQGGGMRFLRFRKWLDDMKELTGGVQEVYFEEVRRHLGVDAAHVYGGFLGTLTAWCEDNELPYQGVPISHIKLHVTGKGNASKQEVIAGVRALGYAPQDHNEADAIALLEWVQKSCSS